MQFVPHDIQGTHGESNYIQMLHTAASIFFDLLYGMVNFSHESYMSDCNLIQIVHNMNHTNCDADFSRIN